MIRPWSIKDREKGRAWEWGRQNGLSLPNIEGVYQLLETKFYRVLLPRFAEGKSEEIAKEALENGRISQGSILEALRCHEATAGWFWASSKNNNKGSNDWGIVSYLFLWFVSAATFYLHKVSLSCQRRALPRAFSLPRPSYWSHFCFTWCYDSWRFPFG